MKVRGTQQLKPEGIHVDVDTVYVHSDAVRVETEDFSGWEYTEKKYRKDDFIRLISEENNLLRVRQESTDDVILGLLLGGV